MKTVIGRIDRADFPELLLKNLKVKVDTGAFTSAIHSHDYKEVEENGIKLIKFKLLDESHPKYNNKEYTVNKYSLKSIKSSFGETEERFVIETFIKLFGEVFPIELSLSDRNDMKYPILLGRRFLNKGFIVDTTQYNLSYKLKKLRLKEKKENK